MKERGLTDLSLSEKVGVKRPTITKIRLGDRRPSLDLAVKLARETGLPVEAFVGG